MQRLPNTDSRVLEESKSLGVEIVDGEEVERSLRSSVGGHVDLSLPSWRLRLGHTQRLNSNSCHPEIMNKTTREKSSGLKQYSSMCIFSPSCVELQHSGPWPTSDMVVK
jgi:hypothetical protein